jgi:type IV pilus assembly protein PilQ
MGFLHFLSKPAKPMLGLDISSSAVKLIELSESAGGYKVEAYRVMPLPTDTVIEFEEAVLQLEVTPQITPDNRIIMDLLMSQDSVGTFTPTGEPSIDITQIETQVLLGDGQTLVLGGIFQTEEVKGIRKVPMLGDIPFLGKLFRNDLRNIEKHEILIFITPKIIDDNLLDR